MKIRPSTAYHEAGHAALAIHLGIGLKKISIIPGHDYDGICIQHHQPSLQRLDYDNSDSLNKRAEKLMMVALAGAEAQRRFAPTSVRRYQAESDIKSVFEYAFALCGDSDEASALVRLLQIRTRNILYLPFVWSGVKALAKRLLKQHEIKSGEARDIFEAASLPKSRRKIQIIDLTRVPETSKEA